MSIHALTRACTALLVAGALAVATPAQSAAAKQVQIKPGQLTGKILESGSRAPAEGHTMSLKNAAGEEIAKVTTQPNGSYSTPPLANGNYTLEVAQGMNLQLGVTPSATIQTLDLVVPATALAASQPETAASETTPAETAQPAAPGGAAATDPKVTPPAEAAPAKTTPTTGASKLSTTPTRTTQAGTAGAGSTTAASSGLGVVGWTVIGVGVAAVAVPVAVASSDSDSESVVSPTTARTR